MAATSNDLPDHIPPMRDLRKSMDWWWRKLRRSLFYAEYRFNRRFGWFFSNPRKLHRNQ